MKISKSYFLTIPLFFLLLTFFGCVTAPVKESIPTYSLHGRTYVSLLALCSRRGISWDYDSLAGTVVLRKGGHKVNFRIGDSLMLVDGKSEQMSPPADIYQGVVVVPYAFKDKVIDSVFAVPCLAPKALFTSSKIKKVVIDAGHGGNDPGTTGRTGLKEKDINLDIAKRLSKLLRDSGVDVVLTRSYDVFVPLSRRVDIANNSRADLFISIHGNANRVRGLNGFEVYYVTPANNNDIKRALTAAKNATLDIEGSLFDYSSPHLLTILWDMIYTSNRAESIQLARALCRTVNRDLDLKVLGVKAANFYVLKGARMPAVLIETGFLSNKNEERLLKNPYYRQQIVEAIMRGIENFVSDYRLAEAR